jgi:mono/diheme cytochrome c family protein
MKLLLKTVGILAVVLVLTVGVVYAWASITTHRSLTRQIAVHDVDFPIPFPLSDEEAESEGLSAEEANALAQQRAIERGMHLVTALYACRDCHGPDFSGGVMVDAFPIGTFLGPNLTTGQGSRAADFTPADWDRIVRHGIRGDGTPATMPAIEMKAMSDRELSDIITYIRSQPPVDNVVPPVAPGPLGKFLIATGSLQLAADVIDHDVTHAAAPPEAEVSVEFGRHLAGPCTGCHQSDFAGGPIPGGDPSWAPAANLTPHADGLAGWTLEQFKTVLREGRRPDGTDVRLPMTLILLLSKNLSDVEVGALWTFLQSLPPTPDRR